MIALIWFVLAALASPFKSKSRLEAENAVLRHQLIVLRRKLKGRARLTNNDRWFFVQLYSWFPSILKVLTVIRPETGEGDRRSTRSCALIRRMSVENPLWGAPRIHGELLKLGFEVAQSSVAKYMVKRRGPPSQGWRTFLRNHAPDIAGMDLFVVPTIGFDLLYALVIVRLNRRKFVWINVTTNPTAEWIARQLTVAIPWDEAPHYLCVPKTLSVLMEQWNHLSWWNDRAVLFRSGLAKSKLRLEAENAALRHQSNVWTRRLQMRY
jgi:hypothetical protein